MKEKEKDKLRANFLKALFEADVKAPAGTAPEAMADTDTMSDDATTAPATDASADSGNSGDALNAPTAPDGTSGTTDSTDPPAGTGEAPGGTGDDFGGGAGGGSGGGGAGFGGGGTPSGEEEATNTDTATKAKENEDPVDFVVNAVKDVAKTNQDVPTILKSIKASLQYNVKSREQIGTIMQKLEAENNPHINVAVNRLKQFFGAKSVQEKKMVKINENDIRRLVQKRLNEMLDQNKRVLTEQANISAVRNLIELAREHAFAFEANFIKELGLMQLDEMDGNSQKVFVDAMKTLHSKFSAAVIDCIKEIENLPKPAEENNIAKK